MIVDNALYRDGVRVPLTCEPSDLGAARAEASGEHDFLWLGLFQPTASELDAVAETFGLHALAVEDALNAHQRPKLDRYDDMLFLVLKTLWYVDEEDAVETGEISLFVGADYIVTVRHGAGSELHASRRDLEETLIRTLAAFGQEDHSQHQQAVAGLGTVNLSTSCNAAAQTLISKGVGSCSVKELHQTLPSVKAGLL